jgi:hypothetical protein
MHSVMIHLLICRYLGHGAPSTYEDVSKSFRLEREMQIVKLSASRCSCIAVL